MAIHRGLYSRRESFFGWLLLALVSTFAILILRNSATRKHVDMQIFVN